jgi:hypothetical protein
MQEWGKKENKDRFNDKASTTLASSLASLITRGQRQGLSDLRIGSIVIPLINKELVEDTRGLFPAIDDDHPICERTDLIDHIKEFLETKVPNLTVPDLPRSVKRARGSDAVGLADDQVNAWYVGLADLLDGHEKANPG